MAKKPKNNKIKDDNMADKEPENVVESEVVLDVEPEIIPLPAPKPEPEKAIPTLTAIPAAVASNPNSGITSVDVFGRVSHIQIPNNR